VWVSSLVDSQQLVPGRAVIQGDAVTTSTGVVPWRLLSGDGLREISSGVATLRRETGGTPRAGERAVWEVELQLPAEGRYEFEVSQPWPGTTTTWVDSKTLVAA
jgi:hypothetical protein